MESNDSSRSWDVMADEVTAVVGDPVDKAATLASVRQRMLDRGSEAAPTLARHILLRRLGAGGSGVVYEAFDPELERKVAIKLLKTTEFHDASLGVARLEREAQAMARLSHRNVITVYDVGSYGAGALSSMVSAPEAERSEGDFPPEGIFAVMELVVRARLVHADDPVAGIELARKARAVPGIDEDPLQRDAIDAWLSNNATPQVEP